MFAIELIVMGNCFESFLISESMIRHGIEKNDSPTHSNENVLSQILLEKSDFKIASIINKGANEIL